MGRQKGYLLIRDLGLERSKNKKEEVTFCEKAKGVYPERGKDLCGTGRLQENLEAVRPERGYGRS